MTAHGPPPTARPLTRFFGRVAELATIGARFAEGRRLVVVTGPAGVGKTRVATTFALGEHADGQAVWFVDAADAVDAATLVAAIARALDAEVGHAHGLADAIEQLGR